MHENPEGFFYPVVDENCVQCGLCINHCPIINPIKFENCEKKFYGLISNKKKLLQKSSSGGVFATIAQSFLSKGGLVFGCAYDEDFNVKHIMIDNEKDLIKLQGSKYVASSTEDTYKTVKENLLNGSNVLYSGSPCHIAGLKSYLGTDYDNLYTMDLICHGTPSLKLFKKYLSFLEKKYNGKVIDYSFRAKERGWGIIGSVIIQTSKKQKKLYIQQECDPYYSSFMRNETFRENCYQCPYATLDNRPADFTIGDFWGVGKYYPQIEREQGVSVCFINTTKGKQLFESVKDDFFVFDCELPEILERNHNLYRPSTKTNVRNNIYEGIDSLPLKTYFKKFKYTNPLMFKIKKIFKRILKKLRIK